MRQNQAPNVAAELSNYVHRYPDAWAHAHHDGDPRAGEWIRLAVQTLRAEHPAGARWALNGKRGDANNPSWDIVAYIVDEAHGDPRMVECYDVIGGAGGPSPSITWKNVTNYATIGQPGTAIAVIPPPLNRVDPGPNPVSILTPRHVDIWTRLGAGSASTAIVAEQFKFSFIGEDWGQKRSGPQTPISDDVIALKWAGALALVRVRPTLQVLGEDRVQTFVPVSAINHMGEPAPNPNPEPEPEPEPRPELAIELRLGEIDAELAVINEGILRILTDVASLRQAVIDTVRSQSYDIDASAGFIGKVKGTITPKR